MDLLLTFFVFIEQLLLAMTATHMAIFLVALFVDSVRVVFLKREGWFRDLPPID